MTGRAAKGLAAASVISHHASQAVMGAVADSQAVCRESVSLLENRSAEGMRKIAFGMAHSFKMDLDPFNRKHTNFTLAIAADCILQLQSQGFDHMLEESRRARADHAQVILTTMRMHDASSQRLSIPLEYKKSFAPHAHSSMTRGLTVRNVIGSILVRAGYIQCHTIRANGHSSSIWQPWVLQPLLMHDCSASSLLHALDRDWAPSFDKVKPACDIWIDIIVQDCAESNLSLAKSFLASADKQSDGTHGQ